MQQKGKTNNKVRRVTFFNYIPSNYLDMATLEEVFLHYTLLDFKDGKRVAQDWAIRFVGNALGGKTRKDTVLVCIPGHDYKTTERRYGRFSEEVCMMCGCENGMPYIHVGDNMGKPSHLRRFRSKEDALAHVQVDKGFFRGKKVIVFDDITTTGRTYNKMAEILCNAGANIIGALFLAKTVRPKPK